MAENDIYNNKERYETAKNNLNYKAFKRAAKLNDVFFNVFVTNQNDEEEVLTVAADGVIIKTMCGV